MSITEELAIFKSGTVDLISDGELLARLELARKENRPLRIKYGADPSCPDIHLGHTVPLRKLKKLQDLGHTVIFLIGDFTARIGDPSQRSDTRKMLTEAEVKENAKTYQKQVFKILDHKRTEVRCNSEWLDRLKPRDFLDLMSRYTVARLLERDDFKKRYEEEKPITMLEFMYPLLQGYDSVVLKSDVELGGTDQKFNLLVGRELQRDCGQPPQIVMTLPLLEGTDGVQKMSKSYGNYIGVNDSSTEMFGKLMSLPDNLMIRYFRYLTDKKDDEVSELEGKLKDGAIHPRDLKARLAREIVESYHGSKEAERANKEFDTIFREKGLPDSIPTVFIRPEKLEEGSIDLVKLLLEANLVASKGEAKRLIAQGGVKVDEIKIDNVNERLRLDKPRLIQCGKRRFARVASS
ncbi:MAG: tyrosine--tRNA ligase [Candidatus Omnitrophica bacterium]|nr:tyrosine--tRNA ligase [Candidatus Omnitrophota bacterium]